jgi:hypothetical protein
MMDEERRRAATSYIIFGLILFLIGAFDYRISKFFRELNNEIQIYDWGWIPQLIGGLLAIYGIMILFEEYATDRRPPSQPGTPSHYLPPPLAFMDKETKKLIWLLLITGLVFYILSPVPLCLLSEFVLVIIMVIIVIILITTYGQRLHLLYPPPYYPPPPQPLYKSPPAAPPIGNIRSCKSCHRPLEPDWVVCPFCGETVSDKN